jgi:hypothetical protein
MGRIRKSKRTVVNSPLTAVVIIVKDVVRGGVDEEDCEEADDDVGVEFVLEDEGEEDVVEGVGDVVEVVVGSDVMDDVVEVESDLDVVVELNMDNLEKIS